MTNYILVLKLIIVILITVMQTQVAFSTYNKIEMVVMKPIKKNPLFLVLNQNE